MLYEVLHELNKSMAVLVVSHELGVVSKYVKSIACLNRTIVVHDSNELTSGMLEHYCGSKNGGKCSMEFLAHGLPHRVLADHKEGEND